MTTISKILDEAGSLAVKELKDTFDDKELNDTSRAKDSINHKVAGNTLIIEGFARVLFLEFGRSPGRFPPIDKLRGWVERKLGVSQDESEGVAYAISKKIAEKGTTIFNDRSKGLQIELTVNMINQVILENITKSLSLEITNGLAKFWKTPGAIKFLQ